MSVTHIERKNKLLANQNLNQLERSTTATWRTPYYELVINLLRFDIFLLWKRYDRPITTTNRLSEREWEQVLLLEQTYKDACSFFSIFSLSSDNKSKTAGLNRSHSLGSKVLGSCYTAGMASESGRHQPLSLQSSSRYDGRSKEKESWWNDRQLIEGKRGR